MFALVFTAYGISHYDQRERTPEAQAIQGAVREQSRALAVPASGESANGAAQPVIASAPAHRLSQAPVRTAHRHSARQYAATSDDLAGDGTDLREDNTGARADVTGSVARARASLDRNSLWPARRAVMVALAAQPGNKEALQIRAELVLREHERDALLDSARQCAREGRWACVWNNASHARSVDVSSREAQKLLSYAVARRGADSGGSFDPVASDVMINQ
ncbi:hypothetical protein [Paraburkholderia pallida]|uniref:Uncharacterized protein n=1 Tax=Paraburkholderia pallida TaxID=2547399 RepID=A0A4P7D4V4_9BURK|nr:hypothetical protein [Paraburkholderia pallida]QBR03078.1 hypothetical protein E1956_38545 [Paraburkholderia pallida]